LAPSSGNRTSTARFIDTPDRIFDQIAATAAGVDCDNGESVENTDQ